MIHVDVRRDKGTLDWRIETSIDGGPWTLQYLLAATIGDNVIHNQLDAEQIARTFIDGIRFAGGEARGTSGGYAL